MHFWFWTYTFTLWTNTGRCWTRGSGIFVTGTTSQGGGWDRAGILLLLPPIQFPQFCTFSLPYLYFILYLYFNLYLYSLYIFLITPLINISFLLFWPKHPSQTFSPTPNLNMAIFGWVDPFLGEICRTIFWSQGSMNMEESAVSQQNLLLYIQNKTIW